MKAFDLIVVGAGIVGAACAAAAAHEGLTVAVVEPGPVGRGPSVAVPASGGVDIIPPVLREAPTQHPARASEDYSMGISRRNISGTVDLIRGPNFFAAKLPCWQTLRDETLKKTAISPADLRVVSRGDHTTDEFVLRRLCLQLSESYPDRLRYGRF